MGSGTGGMVAGPMTTALDNVALPGLGPPPPEPVARSRDPEGALRELFGFPGFRPGQHEAVAAAVAGRDVLVVMPTGSGKSLCYQLPALMRADLTLVVSPLVSLMQDQVEAVERVAPGRVGLVNAQQDAGANRRAVERAAAGELRLLYVAPERFSSPGFLERIRRARVGLFVVDEAHCVSQWGHDFRPDYFRLADAARWLGAGAILASTATATPQVAADIVSRLGLRDPVHVATGFDRPNLSFAVVPCATKQAAHRGIAAALAEPGALPGIVYAGTRADCERLAARLGPELGVEAIAYHAGLPRAGPHHRHHHHGRPHRQAAAHRDLVLPSRGHRLPDHDPGPPQLVRQPAGQPSLHRAPEARRAGRPGRDSRPRHRTWSPKPRLPARHRRPEPAAACELRRAAAAPGRLDER